MDCFFEDRQERCDSAASELHSEIHTFRIRCSFFCGRRRKDVVLSLAFFPKTFLFLRSFFCGEGILLGLFWGNRGVIFRHYAVDNAQRMPTDTGDGVAYPLRSVFRQGMMLVLKIYIPNFEGSRISKSAGSPFVKSRAGGGKPEHLRENEEHGRML